jgi:hypothetical protein
MEAVEEVECLFPGKSLAIYSTDDAHMRDDIPSSIAEFRDQLGQLAACIHSDVPVRRT